MMAKIHVYKERILFVLVSLNIVAIESTLFHQSSVNQIVQIPVSKRPSFKEYIKERDSLFEQEKVTYFGTDVPLNENEELANAVLMAAKNAELDDGLINPGNFLPSQHFFDAVDKINKSKLFKIIQKMPKGGILHAHDTALCSTDYLVLLTYTRLLWQCNDSNKTIISFLFSKNIPDPVKGCEWIEVADERDRIGPVKYDTQLRTRFTLFPNKYRNTNAVWTRFSEIFKLTRPILTYAPVFKNYYKQALAEMMKDGVQYLELRVLLPQVYDLDGHNYSFAERFQFYIDGLIEFKANNSDFIGSKFIFAPSRAVSDETIHEYIDIATDLYSRYPDYIAGFDLVGQEDKGRSLIDLADKLLLMPEEIKFFYHAGETNWFGSIDENLFDAILLGSKRIGHGYALTKHPLLLKMVKDRDIAIEVNPISNQVLTLVDDMRNHPAAVYFSQNIPLVISSDDPSFWEASLLSHDFYEAFLGIASARSDLRTLKKLATNSIKYSSLNKQEKEIAFSKWQTKWDQFIEEVISENL